MILYSQNPDLKLLKVTTIKGDTEYRRNCKYIGGKYYLMDRDCFNVEGKWHRVDGGLIVYDHETKIWIHKNQAKGLIRGIVDFEKDNKPVVGYFSRNIYNNVITKTKSHGSIPAINSEILEKNGFIEDVSVGTWFFKGDMSSDDIRARKVIRNNRSFTDRGYNIEENAKDFNFKVEAYNNYNTTISKKAREMSKYLGDITFGAEIEIAKGNLPENLQSKFGVVICRDGSIDGGPELVTIPLGGAKGLQTLCDLGEALYKRGETSLACSFHLHFGNTRRDKLYVAAVYTLCRRIQDEIFTMFPYYKTDPKGVKKKNYNQKLQRLGIHPLIKTDKESFETYLVDVHAKLFDFFAEGRMTLDQFDKKTREHPVSRKWDRHNRYFWVNLFNMFFGHRHTFEFRLHGPTTNPHKMINWLFICLAILKYADKNALQILKMKDKETVSLKELLTIYEDNFPKDGKARFLSEYLYAYFRERQEAFKKDYKRGDVISSWDIDEDKEYSFSYNGVKGLI